MAVRGREDNEAGRTFATNDPTARPGSVVIPYGKNVATPPAVTVAEGTTPEIISSTYASSETVP